MGILTSAITSICMGITGAGQQACLNGLNAGTKQTGMDHSIDAKEQQEIRLLNEDAYETFGPNGVKIIGGTLYLVKVAQDRGVTVNLPTLGLCDNFTSLAGIDNYSLRLEWRF